MAGRERAQKAAATLKEQERRERGRQFLGLGAVVLVLLAIVFGTYFALSRDKGVGGGDQTPSKADGYALVVGDADAPTTIRVYEDPQCPVCAQFEKVVGKKLAKAVDDGRVKVEYRIVSFLDDASANEYSSRAANLLVAVYETAGPEAFQKLHDDLYANQPAEGGPGPEDAALIEAAVAAGATKSEIEPLVEDKAFGNWLDEATDQMSKDKVRGTPAVFINDEMVEGSPQDAANAVLAEVE